MIAAKTFYELNNQELYQILRLRSEVFVVEQECVYQDLDNKDQISIHIFQKEKDEIVAYTRIFKSGDYYKNPSIGRVVVSKKNRGKELGKKIMIYSIEYIKNNLKGAVVQLVRTPACQAGGRGFKSRQSRNLIYQYLFFFLIGIRISFFLKGGIAQGALY